MISGKLALGGLSLEFGDSQRRFAEASDTVKALAKAQRKLLAEEKEIIEQLARTYLPELSPEALSAGLVQLGAKMEKALAEQAGHRRELLDQIGELPEAVSRRELLVAEAEGAEERAARALDAIRRDVERDLSTEAEYARHVAEHKEIMERRSILKARRSRLQTTANVERFRYEEDRAFRYLKDRQYGEPGYRAGFLVRWLDGRLARRIDYVSLARNYRILRTGPHAMRSEVRQLSERAEELEAIIDEQEAEVAARLELTGALEAEAAAQRGLVDARQALSDVRQRHDRLAAEVRAVDANRGQPYEDAVAMYREFLEDQTIKELLDIARSTPDPKDDDLVSRLEETRTRMKSIGSELGSLRAQLERTATQTTSFGELARRAATHFSSRRSEFPEEFNLGKLVRSIMDGDADTEMAFRSIAASHEKRPLLFPGSSSDFDGWFAELSSQYDPELGAVEVRRDEHSDIDSEMVVYDAHGRVIHRRVTKRTTGG